MRTITIQRKIKFWVGWKKKKNRKSISLTLYQKRRNIKEPKPALYISPFLGEGQRNRLSIFFSFSSLPKILFYVEFFYSPALLVKISSKVRITVCALKLKHLLKHIKNLFGLFPALGYGSETLKYG